MTCHDDIEAYRESMTGQEAAEFVETLGWLYVQEFGVTDEQIEAAERNIRMVADMLKGIP